MPDMQVKLMFFEKIHFYLHKVKRNLILGEKVSSKGSCAVAAAAAGASVSWELKSAKKCVTTHLPNQRAPKIDDA